MFSDKEDKVHSVTEPPEDVEISGESGNHSYSYLILFQELIKCISVLSKEPFVQWKYYLDVKGSSWIDQSKLKPFSFNKCNWS